MIGILEDFRKAMDEASAKNKKVSSKTEIHSSRLDGKQIFRLHTLGSWYDGDAMAVNLHDEEKVYPGSCSGSGDNYNFRISAKVVFELLKHFTFDVDMPGNDKRRKFLYLVNPRRKE